MEDFNNKIDVIRNAMEELRGEKYALVNPHNAALDGYVKNLYLKLLCTVVQYKNEPTELQLLYLKRILSGMEAEYPLEEYMRMAAEITLDDVVEFLSLMKDSDTKYYFALEGVLLTVMGGSPEENYVYLAEIMELSEITKNELQHLCEVAKSVLRQDTALFDEAKLLADAHTKHLDFWPYINNYYAGAIVDTETEKHYVAPDQQKSSGVIFKTEYKEKTVIFENLVISIDEQWNFNGCEEVVFRNCRFSGKGYFIRFESVGSVKVEDCRFQDFSDGVFVTDSVKNMRICKSEFLNCGRMDVYYGRGGVIQACGDPFDTLSICDSKFLNCYITARKSGESATGVALGFNDYSSGANKLIVTGNEFTGCKCINNKCYTDAIIGIDKEIDFGDKRIKEIEIHDNRLWGEVTRMYEEPLPFLSRESFEVIANLSEKASAIDVDISAYKEHGEDWFYYTD